MTNDCASCAILDYKHASWSRGWIDCIDGNKYDSNGLDATYYGEGWDSGMDELLNRMETAAARTIL